MKLLVVCFLAVTAPFHTQAQYTPDWPSIDSRPLPSWYDEAKIGIFIHWGVYAVPAAANEWFWFFLHNCKEINEPWCPLYPEEYMEQYYKPGFTYQEFAPQFTAEFWKPDDWARLFARAGARYVVLTSKHHDGYTLWPSKNAYGWNVMDVGPKRDLVGELAESIRRVTPDIKFGLYHSLFEWYNPLWLQDEANGFNTTEFVERKSLPDLYDIVSQYHPEVVWSDGEWLAPSSYWRATEFIAWLYNESPVKDTVVTNDRWGSDTRVTHGGFYSGEDRQNPGVLLPHKWENAFTLDWSSWGWRGTATIDDYMSIEVLIKTIIMTVSCGGNALVNVGPSKDGMIPIIQQERLVQMGQWLGLNSDAIYSSVPHTVQNDTLTPDIWYTRNIARNQVYAMVIGWRGRTVRLGSMSVFQFSNIGLLGNSEMSLNFTAQNPGILVDMPQLEDVQSKWAYTLVFKGTT